MSDDNITLTPAQCAELQHIVTEWIDEGFTTPPYESVYYNIFEILNIDPDSVMYNIQRPK